MDTPIVKPGDKVLLAVPLSDIRQDDDDVSKMRWQLMKEFPDVDLILIGISGAKTASAVMVYRPDPE